MALLLAGCSTLKLGYNQGPGLTYWWLDRYADFNSDQAPQVRAALDRWFAWHRRTQMPDYAALLERARVEALADTTPAKVCSWWDVFIKRRDAALDEAAPAIAEIAVTLAPQQLDHLARKFDKNTEELRDDYVQPDLDERAQSAMKRTVERMEDLYGRLNDTQRDLVARRLATSPWDPEKWLADRDRRNRDTLATLRDLAQRKPPPDQALATVRAWLERAKHLGADAASREAYARLTDYNCSFVAELHNTTTARQRKHASEKVAAWERDVASLAGLQGAVVPSPAMAAPIGATAPASAPAVPASAPGSVSEPTAAARSPGAVSTGSGSR